LVRAVGTALAPLWVSMLMAPEVAQEYDRIGLPEQCRYFAPRAAPLGAVPAPVVTSTFFNFSPTAVARAIPDAWNAASPEEILAAQLAGVDRAFTRAFADTDPAELAPVAELMKAAALAACELVDGRALFSGYAALPWPQTPELMLFHGHYLLREFRGDGHIAAMVAAGLRGIDALALHVVMVPALAKTFRASRAWTDEQWDEAHDQLVADGWLARDRDGRVSLTDVGRTRREELERQTDRLAAPAYAAIGAGGSQRLVDFKSTLDAAMSNAGLTWRPRASPTQP
jgi:hypothetical protein